MIKKSCIFIGQEDNLKLGALYRWKNTLKVVKKRALAKQGKTFFTSKNAFLEIITRFSNI